jgi:hypothetical protein
MARKPKDITPKASEWAGAGNEAFDVLLSKEEQTALKLEAEKEIAEEQKQLASDEFKAQIKNDLKKKNIFHDATEGDKSAGKITIFFDLPLMSPHAVLDGRRFVPGRTYNVNQGVAEVLQDIMQQNFRHEAELQGPEKMRSYRAKKAYSQPSHAG